MRMEVNSPVVRNDRVRLNLKFRALGVYALLILLAIVMVYPILWLVSVSFKPNSDIFTTNSLIPNPFVISSYINGWSPAGPYTYATFFWNTFKLVVPTVVFTI